MANRHSIYSSHSGILSSGSSPHGSQFSTTTLLNALHSFYTTGQPYQLDAGTSLVVNTWITATQSTPDGRNGSTIDRDLAQRALEHARRRAEDGCIVLCTTHRSTPSLLEPFLSSFPLKTPNTVFTSFAALRPFLTAVTSFNPSYCLYSSLAACYTFTFQGTVVGLKLALSTSGINVQKGLIDIPAEPGYRAFDVFYYLLTSASTPAERDFLALKDLSEYSFLNKSATYTPPSYIPVADDDAAAEDFRGALRAIGIKGASLRGLLSVLAGLLKLGNATSVFADQEVLEEVCDEVGGLLGLDPDILLCKCSTDERSALVSGVYEALVDWVIGKANEAIAKEIQADQENGSHNDTTSHGGHYTDEDTVSITVLDIPRPALGKGVAMRGVFDDDLGINAEMKQDGIPVRLVGHSVRNEMSNAVTQVEADLGITTGSASREREQELDKRRALLEKIGVEIESDAFLQEVLYPIKNEGIDAGRRCRFDLAATLSSSRVWYHISIHPADDPLESMSQSFPTSVWSAGSVSRQLREWRFSEWANRRLKQLDFTADFDIEEFCSRYCCLGCMDGKDGVENWILERGWSNSDAVVGHQRVWMRENAWWEAETMLDLKADEQPTNPFMYGNILPETVLSSNTISPAVESESLRGGGESFAPGHSMPATSVMGGAKSLAPSMHRSMNMVGDYGLGLKGDEQKGHGVYYDELGELDPEFGGPKRIEKEPVTMGRRAWTSFVWLMTFWIPSFALRYIGRMKRPDVRMAWREKFVLFSLIVFSNACVVFYIVAFGNLLCPNRDKVWNEQQLSFHQGDNDFYVGIHGKVYDITKFWRIQHSDTAIKTTPAIMEPFAGQILDAYFPPPLTQACRPFVTDEMIKLLNNDTNAVQYPYALHDCGPINQPDPNTKLHKITWYADVFLPKIREYYKGEIVWTRDMVQKQANDDQRYWVILDNNIYDLTNYFYTLGTMNDLKQYNWLPSGVTDLFKGNAGADITEKWQDSVDFQNALNCLNNVFYVGKVDFRQSPKCTVNNWILLSFTVMICAVVLTKFLAALQLGSKRRPAPQDKFVICLVPAYTEGEDALRKSLDSLTMLEYDSKRKLICVICDGVIVGAGNDRPTPKIVLDILGVDPKVDPPALPFKSIGKGSDQLNYGKVYSGLYEYEGNVVPYIVIVKVGKESEQAKSKPGNRGKRDSQILALSFLSRVHHRAPMSPLELEIFHQINNVIGVDPELYEYCLMVDADTSLKEDSLNRLVAACANDARIAGICGETSLQNEQRSWWTMIQVYEYYISHHLAKAFESLFGSVTCLPGCFCMYRLRTADKGRPLIISEKVISEYADNDIDTLHKRNLFSLGEDRYLTTLMTKHFPSMSYKFIPDAYAATAAPETWSVLVSQRRRWINSTVHNLVELAKLSDLCGFCCFSMRFVVFVDLLGTIILPSTLAYIVYLIYRVGSHTGPLPIISIIILASVYGLQMIIFIVKRQWQHIGWMIIYLCAFPIYSFVLPLYSFWMQDDFTWGNTRIVIGEKGDKRVVATDTEVFDPRSIPLQRWDDYALANNLPGRRRDFGFGEEKLYQDRYVDDIGMEMDDLHSTYSSVKPASTILTGLPGQTGMSNPYLSSQSTVLGGQIANNRNSRFSGLTRFSDHPAARHMSANNLSQLQGNSMNASRYSMGVVPSTENLLGPSRPISRSPVGGYNTRPASSAFDFKGPDESAITEAIRSCLGEVDLDSVTKKQVRALVEQRLQTTLSGEKKAFLDRQIDQELANM